MARADQARQALRAAGARQQPQLDLRQPQRGARRRQPIVAPQRKLQRAAQRRAIEQRHHGHRRVLDAVYQFGQPGILVRPCLVELLDIRASRENARTGADQQQRPHVRPGVHLLQALRQAVPQRPPQCIHRRAVQGHDFYVAPHRDRYRHIQAPTVSRCRRSRPRGSIWRSRRPGSAAARRALPGNSPSWCRPGTPASARVRRWRRWPCSACRR
ncbi:Uncharacterised protein [Bordetella pertussis]|nr:Uncharacterised protein [Bordetella pertussis]CPM16585.1 Uncharacterised protein [Bordetella pertussis]CPM73921.1 Uncharacterised protein [Bordetella pertussis]CPN70770.1 Uncharacterised protein [Bordetella pertussis]